MSPLMSRFVAVLAAGLFVPAFSAQAAQWTVVPEASTLTVEGTQTGASFTGRFETFTANIDFDRDDPAVGTIRVQVDTGSFASGASDRDDMAVGEDWFAVDLFPQAQFVSDDIVEVEDGSYVANGDLTIRNVSLPVALPFRLEVDGSQAVAEGELTLDRLDFGVGQGDWENDSVVGTDVTVRFHIEADRQ